MNKKYFLISILVFSLFLTIQYASSSMNVSNCGDTLAVEGEWELNASINGTATCLTIAASNIQLDCMGKTISFNSAGGSTTNGINVILSVTPLSNITIKNCNITDINATTGTTGVGISFTKVSNSYIFNNTINTNGTSSNHGIYLNTGTNYNRIENNTVNVLGTLGTNYGIYFINDADDNNITNNLVNVSGNLTSYALYLSTDADDNLVYNNTFISNQTSRIGNTDGHTVYLLSSGGNNISGNRVETYGLNRNYAVQISTNAEDNIIENNTIIVNATAATNYGVYSVYSPNNTIKGNMIKVIGSGTLRGIYSVASDSNIIQNNILLLDNNVSAPTIDGIYTSSSQSNIIQNNTLSINGTTPINGIYTSSAPYNVIQNNSIVINGTTAFNGIITSSSTANIIKDNWINLTANTITVYGIYIAYGTSTVIQNNIANVYGTSALYGVFLRYTSISNIVEGNTLTTYGTTTNPAVNLNSGANNNIIRNNTLITNGSGASNHGVLITSCNDNIIEYNNISTNGTTTSYGVSITTHAENNTVAYNDIHPYGTTTVAGVYITAADANRIIGNNMTVNGSTHVGATNNYGIAISTNANTNKAYNNTIYTEGGGGNVAVYIFSNSFYNYFEGNQIFSGGNGSRNHGVHFQEANYNTVKSNNISTNGTSLNFGVYFNSSSSNNLVENNNISTLNAGTSDAFNFLSYTGGNFPGDNTIKNNTLSRISGLKLNFSTAAINGTWLINQEIGNYSFTGIGSLINIKNTSAGEIRFLQYINGTNTTFSDRVFVSNNFARIDEYTRELNESAEITLYNIPTASTELQIMRYNAVCPATVCVNLTSMQAGNVTFNVTGGGNFSILATTSIPNIVLNLPGNSYNTSSKNISFNFTATDDVSTLLNCSIYVDSIINQSNSTTLSGSMTNFLVESLTEGNHSWYIRCFDGALNSNISETRSFNITILRPSITKNYPGNNSYLNNLNSLDINYTVFDSNLREMTVWFYGGYPNGTYSLLNTSSNIANGTNLSYHLEGLSLGQHNWTVIANNGLYNSTNNYSYFNIINLTMNCEAGGPYNQNALILTQGNLSDGILGLSSQTINASIYKNNIITTSKTTDSASGGSFQTTFSSLSVGTYTLNVSSTYNQISKSCIDTFVIGGSASIVLDKLISLYNITNSTINYNITLSLTNKGGSDATLSNITDVDSLTSFYDIGTLTAGQTDLRSYIKSYPRNSTVYYNTTNIAQAFGVDSYSNAVIFANSTIINLTIPDTSAGIKLTILKNIAYVTGTNDNITYNVSDEVINSGDQDLTDIIFTDQDVGALSLNLNISEGNSSLLSSLKTIDREATNSNHEFVLGTATVSGSVFNSNQPLVRIPGKGGGPNDVKVYAPTSVATSTSFDTVINVTNQNPDISQDFVVDYWITSNDEATNYSSSGQQTIYVAALETNSTTVTLTSPSSAGTYRVKASVSGTSVTTPATSYDAFDVTSGTTNTTTTTTTTTTSGGGSAVTKKTTDEIVCPVPYMRYGKECCLDVNNNSICDNDEEKPKTNEQQDNQNDTSTVGSSKKPKTLSGLFDKIKEYLNVFFTEIKNKDFYHAIIFGFGILILLLIIIILKLLKNKKKNRLGKKASSEYKRKIKENLKKIRSKNLVIIITIGLILMGAFSFSGNNMTGYVIGDSISASNNQNIFGFIFIIGAIGLMTFFYRKEIIETVKERTRAKNSNNSIKGLVNKKVYTDEGEYLGDVRDVFLGTTRIDSLKIKLDKIKKFGPGGVIVRYNQVVSVGDIVIIKGDFLQHLENYKN